MAGLSHLPHLSQNLLTATSPAPPWLALDGNVGAATFSSSSDVAGQESCSGTP